MPSSGPKNWWVDHVTDKTIYGKGGDDNDPGGLFYNDPKHGDDVDPGHNRRTDPKHGDDVDPGSNRRAAGFRSLGFGWQKQLLERFIPTPPFQS
jgi:hypothetical protein